MQVSDHAREYEVLAMRLLLAWLHDDPAETAYHCWAIAAESGCNHRQFQVANRTAREAAGWWKASGRTEDGRQRINAKLEKLTGVPA